MPSSTAAWRAGDNDVALFFPSADCDQIESLQDVALTQTQRGRFACINSVGDLLGTFLGTTGIQGTEGIISELANRLPFQ